MDRSRAVQAFEAYAGRYDVTDVKVKLKIDHTYRVADICDRIAEGVGADREFAWLLGLLHDIGRFEQLKNYNTFIDVKSVDHAELGADILFKDGLIASFPLDVFEDSGSGDCKPVEELGNTAETVARIAMESAKESVGTMAERRSGIAETAIRLHNKLALPEEMDEETALYCRILRDADKVDIFRVITEPPYDERNVRILKGAADGTMKPARDKVMDCVREHRCVPRTFERTEFESVISQCCMGFELNYPISRSIAKEQGYLDTLMKLDVADAAMREQLATLRREMHQALTRQ